MIEKPQIYAGEALEPLGDGRFIIQPEDGCGYRFGKDSVALACFASQFIGRGERVLELCSGCGIVGITLNSLTGADVVGVEIDSDLCSMSVRSAAAIAPDGLRFIRGDVREITSTLAGRRVFDAVVCNPPFFKADSKPAAVAPAANSELTVTFGDIAFAAAHCLKQGGDFIIVHTATRLDEVMCTCREHKLMPKVLTLNANGKTFLLRAVLGGNSGLSVSIKEFECYTS